jgi:hypothetical protein
MSNENDRVKHLREVLAGGVPYHAPVDHRILDVIIAVLKMRNAVGETSPIFTWNLTRESECLEFDDPKDGKRYEIVIREID